MLKFLPPVLFSVVLYCVFLFAKKALADPAPAPQTAQTSSGKDRQVDHEKRIATNTPAVRTEVFCRGYASGNGRTLAWLTNGSVLVGTNKHPIIVDINGVRKDGTFYPFRRPEPSATILRPSANVIDVWKGVTASPGGTEGRPANLVNTASKEAK